MSVCTTRDAALSCGRASRSGSTAARSPNRKNSMSGWRLRDSSAPGTTTAAPWSPPMASSAMRTLWGMARQYRVDRSHNQGGGQSPLVAALPFFQRSERRKWMRRIVADRRALERGIRLARIRIEAEDQKFGRNGAEIDPAANQLFRHIDGRHLDLCAADQRERPGRHEHEVDRFVDFVLERLERDHAGLADGGRDPANHVQAAAPMQCNVEASLESGQGNEAGMLGDRSARLRISHEIEVASTLGHIAECKPHAPKTFGPAFGFDHCLSLVDRAHSSTCSGSGNASCARSNPS